MEEQADLIKVIYIAAFAVVASYYFWWGENAETVTDPIDESGWVPDGEFAKAASEAEPGA